MEPCEIVKRLEPWLETYGNLRTVCDAMKPVFGTVVESPLTDAIWNLFSRYTAEIAAAVGDTTGNLEWFIWENDAGKKAFPAKCKSWPDFRPIRDLHDLAALIHDV